MERAKDEAERVDLPDPGEEPVADPSPDPAPATRPAMSTISTPAQTIFLEWWSSASFASRSSGTCATAVALSVVVNGCGATGVDEPVRALKSEDFPAFGRPTSPMRSTGAEATRRSPVHFPPLCRSEL